VLEENYGEDYSIVKILFIISVNEVVRKVPVEIKVRLFKRTCDECIRSITGSYRVLIQFRAEGRPLNDKEISVIDKIISNPIFINSIVEKQEFKHGIDVKVSSLAVARAIAKRAVNELNAKVIETFKSKKYDSQKGVWIGETVLSLRIPSIVEDAIVEYNGRFWIVRDIGKETIRLENLETGKEIRIDFQNYWRGLVRIKSYLSEHREAKVIGYDSNTVYLLDETSGEVIEVSRSGEHDFRQGEVVYIVKIDNKNFIVRKSC